MTLEEIMQYHKKYGVVNNETQGWLFVDKENWLCVDYGYCCKAEHVKTVEIIPPPEEDPVPFWEKRPDLFADMLT